MSNPASLKNKLFRGAGNSQHGSVSSKEKPACQNSSNHLTGKSQQQNNLQNHSLINVNAENDFTGNINSTHSLSSLPIYASTPFIIQPKLSVNEPGDKYEHEADNIAEKIIGMPGSHNQAMKQSVNPLSANIHPVESSTPGNSIKTDEPFTNKIADAKGKGNSMDTRTQNFMSAGFGFNFSRVKIHTDDGAAKMNRQLKAKAFTVGDDIYFSQNNYDPSSQSGKHLLAHELAHTVQQSSNRLIMRKSLTDLPEVTRKQLQVSRTAPDKATVDQWIKDFFTPKSGISMSSSMTTEFGVEITDADLQKGLRNVAISLKAMSHENIKPATKDTPEERSNTDPEGWPLGPNSVLDIAMDLSNNGGDNAIFRFTSYTDGKDEKVIIERMRIIAPVVAPAAPAAVVSSTGNITVGNVKVDIDAAFGNARGKIIADAIQLLPDPIRLKIDGVKIVHVGSGSGPDGRNGDYQAENDRVRIWDNMFNEDSRRVGESSSTTYQVVHELMHAIDLRPLFKAQIARDDAQKRKDAFVANSRKIKVTSDPLGEPEEKSDAEKKVIRDAIAKFDKEIADDEKEMASAKSEAGSELGKNTESLTTDFGKALAADGVKAVKDAKKKNAVAGATQQHTLSTGITNYGATDLMEAFAENFSLYILDEALLKTLRPKTFEFFAKEYPKPAAATP
ncbi:MAG: DUF4157 domain-containing protein [Ginsengibacter sp.]